jgi:hypothetical protein
MTAYVRTISPHDAVSFEGMDRRNAARPLAFLPVRNFGGASASFGLQSLHHFFSQAGKTDPHTRLSQTILSTERIEGETDQHSQTILTRKRTMGEVDLSLDQKSGDAFAKRANAIKPAELVNEAAQWAAKLTDEAERKTGKTDTALETVARQTGVNQSTLWRLRYRKPKDLAVSVYMRLKAAFEAAEKRQYERDKHAATIAGSLGAANSDVLQKEAQEYVDFYESRVVCKINNGAAVD